MKVISLFDGMSCGQLALEEAGFWIDEYYASEINKDAMLVAKDNFPSIQHIGDVTKVNGFDYDGVDLLIGGSPCQGFSFAGKQLNFEDPRSKLFFEFVRIKKEANPKYFFLENVKMKKEYRDVISRYLEVEPVFVDSSNFSAHNRPRWYWTNIPGAVSRMRTTEGLKIKDILCSDIDDGLYLNAQQIERGYAKGKPQKFKSGSSCGLVAFPTPLDRKVKSMTVTRIRGSREVTHIQDVKGIRLLSRNELEMAQTVPKNYTRAVSYDKAAQMLGNGWTVSVIADFFKNIPNDLELL